MDQVNVALAGLGYSLISYEKRLGVVSNNIANANTDGYKHDVMVAETFGDFVQSALNEIGTTFRTVTSFSQGRLTESGSSNDVAVDGNGFLTVLTGQGTQVFSRGGALSRNDEGYLVDAAGNYILGAQGRIAIDSDGFIVSRDGTVSTESGVKGKLAMAAFVDEQVLQKLGNGYFTLRGNGARGVLNASVMQGYSEKSNTEITSEFTRMMELSRRYEASQRTIQIVDEINGKAVSEIGRL